METFLCPESQQAWMDASALQRLPYHLSDQDVYISGDLGSSRNDGGGLYEMDSYAVDAFTSVTEEDLQCTIRYTEEDVLMLDRPLLDYITNMLMDESIDDQNSMSHDFVAYQSIVSGFYDIIGENASIHFEPTSSSNSCGSNDTALGSCSSTSLSTAPSTNGINDHDDMSRAMTPSISGDDGGDHRFGHVLGKNSMLTQISYNSMYLSDVANTAMDRSRSSGMNDGGYFLMQDVPSMNYMGHMKHHPFVPTDDIFAVQSESPDSHVPSVKNDDLNLESDYERLYLNRMHNDLGEGKDYGGRITEKNHYMNATEKPRSQKMHVRGKKGQVGAALDNGVGISNRRLEAGTALELTELLVSCAQAVSVGDSLRAFGTLQQLRKNGVSPNGNGLHRVIYYFCEALEVRMNGIGTRAYYEAAYGNQLSVSTLLKVTKTALNFIPMFKLAHYFANQSILKAAEGATSLHIVDYGMFFGLQWPCLINALADCKGGPPMLTITAIGFPQPGDNPAKQLEDIGDRLSEYAKTYNVPFKYHAIAASNWEDLDLLSHTAHNGVEEILVVNCIHSLHHVLDECILASDKSTSCPRQRLLEKMCKLSPNLFVMASLNAAHNSPFFVPRFKEALNYYCSKFDMVDTVWDNSPERMTIEKDCFYRDILNVIACEGPERVERPEMYKQWQARIERAGFQQMPIMPIMLPRSRAFLKKYYHKDFHIDHNANCWMLLSWKGRTMEAISAWKPRIMHN